MSSGQEENVNIPIPYPKTSAMTEIPVEPTSSTTEATTAATNLNSATGQELLGNSAGTETEGETVEGEASILPGKSSKARILKDFTPNLKRYRTDVLELIREMTRDFESQLDDWFGAILKDERKGLLVDYVRPEGEESPDDEDDYDDYDDDDTIDMLQDLEDDEDEISPSPPPKTKTKAKKEPKNVLTVQDQNSVVENCSSPASVKSARSRRRPDVDCSPIMPPPRARSRAKKNYSKPPSVVLAGDVSFVESENGSTSSNQANQNGRGAFRDQINSTRLSEALGSGRNKRRTADESILDMSTTSSKKSKSSRSSTSGLSSTSAASSEIFSDTLDLDRSDYEIKTTAPIKSVKQSQRTRGKSGRSN